MAKYECNLNGNFHAILADIDNGILSGSISASLEDGSDFNFGEMLCAVRVYERFSVVGNNRVSLNLTLFGSENGGCVLSAIASGGSQAVFFKLNTFGEQSFLDGVVRIIDKYRI